MKIPVVDLCSSPEPPQSLIKQSKSRQPEKFPGSQSLDWHELSSDISEESDLQSSHIQVDTLPIIPSINEKHKYRGTENEIVDLVSDEFEIENPHNSTSRDTLGKICKQKGIAPSRDFHSQSPPPGQKKSSRTESSAHDLDVFRLSDPFTSSPIKKRRGSSLPEVSSTVSFPVVGKHQKLSTKTSNSSIKELEEEEEPSLKVNNTVFGPLPSDLSSSPSISDLLETEKKQKRKMSLVVSDDDGDESWIRDLVNQIEKKKVKTKVSTSRFTTSAHQRKAVSKIDENSDIRDPTTSKIPSNSGDESSALGLEGQIYEKKDAKAMLKRQDKNDRIKAKEAEKIRKLKEKEQKNREKEINTALAKSNKLKSRHESTSEMIVDLPLSMDERLASQAKVFLEGVNAQQSTYSNSNNVIKWRRKVQAEWDSEKDQWQPVVERILDDKYIMCVLNSADLVELIRGTEGHDLNAFMLRLTIEFIEKDIIFIIEGMKSWMAKNKAIKNKHFADTVRNQISQPEDQPGFIRRQRKKTEIEYIDETLIEDALLRLQVIHRVLIHHTHSSLETAEWIMRFTQHISTIPYRKQLENINTSNFCIELGQIDSGKNTKDTYIQMLQQMRLVTPSVAWGIESKYRNVQALIRGLEENGPYALEQCRKSANKNGSFTDAKIGQAISRRVHSVFLGRDPWSGEV